MRTCPKCGNTSSCACLEKSEEPTADEQHEEIPRKFPGIADVAHLLKEMDRRAEEEHEYVLLRWIARPTTERLKQKARQGAQRFEVTKDEARICVALACVYHPEHYPHLDKELEANGLKFLGRPLTWVQE